MNDSSDPSAPRPASPQRQFVLVVDDHPPVLEAVQFMLEHYGYSVLRAASGSEAVQICTRRPGEVLVVVTDMMMPQMDGLATIQALRALDPSLRFVGISGSVDRIRIREFSAVGLVALLQKPFSVEELVKAVRRAAQA